MDCFGKAYLFLIERTLARYGYTAEIKITRKSEEEKKPRSNPRLDSAGETAIMSTERALRQAVSPEKLQFQS